MNKHLVRRSGPCGFTLLELLTVMAIIIILMSLCIVAYQGIMRGSGMQGAILNLRSSLILARQYSIAHRCRTHVVFRQDGTNAQYVVCAEEGKHEGTGNDPNLILSRDRWVAGELVDGTVYNFDDKSYARVSANTARTLTGTLTNGVHNKWDAGDKYGWAIRDETPLPRGFAFSNGSTTSTPQQVVFNADGTTPLGASSNYEIWVKELYVSTPTQAMVKVKGMSGMIEVQW